MTRFAASAFTSARDSDRCRPGLAGLRRRHRRARRQL